MTNLKENKTLTSNYLQEKYPVEGYNKPFYAKNSMPWEKGKTSKEEADRYEKIKYLPCTQVCKCGKEWESNLGKYQEGCYPYCEDECKDCRDTREAKEKKQRKEAYQRQLVAEFDEKIPPRYRGKLTTPINEILITSTCSIIWGGFGTGKTWEAYTVAKELMRSSEIKTFELMTEVDLLNSLKDNFDDMHYKISKYKNIDLLILDEAGKNNDSDFNKAQLFGILNHRYDWEKKTILICNAKTKEEIRELLPTATLDRFRECVVEMTGQSRRYK